MMARRKNWEFAAKSVWGPLTEAAKSQQVIHYEKLAPHMGTTSRNVGLGLEPITRFCIDMELPHLTSIVVNKNTGKPGKGFYGFSLGSISEAQKRVFEFDWGNEINPFAGISQTESTDTLAKSLYVNPEKSQEVYYRLKARGSAQLVFRKLILKAYKNKCAICGLDIVEALEAAHIVPWPESTPQERISANNGILLCANHHRLFDSDHVKINSRYEIVCKKISTTSNYLSFDQASISKLSGQVIQLPARKNLWPDPILLDRRFHKNLKQ